MTEFDNFYRQLYRKESVAAIKELMEALEDQASLKEKSTQATGIGPGHPMKRGEMLAEAAFPEVARVERRVKEAHERVNRFRQSGPDSLI